MPKINNSWGIEVGSDAIKAIRLVRQGSEVVVDQYYVEPFKKILTTPDLDVENVIRDGLSKFYSQHNPKRDVVMASVPGSTAFAKFAKLPPVDPKKIPDIVKFEAVQQIPFPIDQVEWDYQVFSHSDTPDVEVGIFAITKDRVGKFLDNFAASGQSLDGLTLSALAVYNALAYDLRLSSSSPGIIFMDIGTSSTDVIIVEGGDLWLRTLPIGGNSFTEALVRAFKLSFSKAEKLKREAGTSKYTRQIFQAMRPVFADLIQEMQRTLGYYQSMNRDANITKLIGVGSSFRLPGMPKFLKQQLQIEVRRLDGFERISVEGKQEADFSLHSLNLVTAYGLALQGLGLEQVHANILPIRVIKQRLWRAKQPWIAAAAALVAMAVGGAWVRLEVDKSRFETELQNSQLQVTRVMTQANQYIDQWRQIEGGADPRSRIESLRRALDYREIWPKIMQDITLAMREMGAQPELLGAQYDAMDQIPRSQRRRLYIDSITSEYRYGALETETIDTSIESGISDEVWDGAQGALSSVGVAQEGLEETFSDDNQDHWSPAPSFVITIKGTTPHRDGPKLISQHFVNWLQVNRRRDDRPYEIIVTKKALKRIEKITVQESEKINKARQVTRREVQPRILGRRAARSRDERHTLHTADQEQTRDYNLDTLFPKRPVGGKAQTGDWSFEIHWTIELLRPERSRQTEGMQDQVALGKGSGHRDSVMTLSKRNGQ